MQPITTPDMSCFRIKIYGITNSFVTVVFTILDLLVYLDDFPITYNFVTEFMIVQKIQNSRRRKNTVHCSKRHKSETVYACALQ